MILFKISRAMILFKISETVDEIGHFTDIWIEYSKFIPKYDKLYIGHLFMGHNFTRNLFMTSK